MKFPIRRKHPEGAPVITRIKTNRVLYSETTTNKYSSGKSLELKVIKVLLLLFYFILTGRYFVLWFIEKKKIKQMN